MHTLHYISEAKGLPKKKKEKQQVIDPGTGFPIDPNTGFAIDPNTGQMYDPNTSQPIDPNTGKPMEVQSSGENQVQQGQVQQGQVQQPLETGLSPEEEQELEFDSLKKYIIYNKIRELKDKIEDSNIVISDEYRKVLYFINIILNFFDIFEYNQLVGMTDSVVTQIEKMKVSI